MDAMTVLTSTTLTFAVLRPGHWFARRRQRIAGVKVPMKANGRRGVVLSPASDSGWRGSLARKTAWSLES
jgi:hypothetical protein